MKRLFNILLSVFRALIIVFSLQLILLAVSTILGYSPNTVLSKLYNIIGLDFFFILSKASGVKGLLSLIRAFRSEEHTSELQSQSNLVCRLLLEKKKSNAAATVFSRRTAPTPPFISV